MTESDVWRSAKQLVEQYGEKAVTIAADRFVELHKADDDEGVAAWVRIMLAIRELTSKSLTHRSYEGTPFLFR